MSAFATEPLAELRRHEARARLRAALGELDARLPLRVCSLVGGEPIAGPVNAASFDPGAPERAVAEVIGGADVGAAVGAAVEAARAAFGDWSERPAGERVALLRAGAARVRDQREALAALIVRECAKPWIDADAEVAEAIDFLEYYAHGALELARGRALLCPPGERNTLSYHARGVAAVIGPWNFPLAIPCGMAAAALVTGNTVVLKPAEQSPACGERLVALLHEAGVPGGVLNLLLGDASVGAALVKAPVQTIAFTGSREVGLEIVELAGRTEPGQLELKRVVAELGGKNCVIVDSDADLDEAVPAITRSAFSYAGQKCSAAARVLVQDALAEDLARRLTGAIELLVVGQAEDFATEVPALIERSALERVERYRALAREQGRLPANGPRLPAGTGYFAAPALVTGLPGDSPLLDEEIFGPLLTLETVGSLDDAFATVRASSFALTGGFFSRHPEHVRRAIAELPVGNLYINRQITGAVVGRQPFGGNRLSGNGTKAGGPDYLLAFVESRVASENTIRHGLVV